jgi:hypothetical protein
MRSSNCPKLTPGKREAKVVWELITGAVIGVTAQASDLGERRNGIIPFDCPGSNVRKSYNKGTVIDRPRANRRTPLSVFATSSRNLERSNSSASKHLSYE